MYRRFIGVFFVLLFPLICSSIGTFLFSFAIPVLLMPNAKDSTEQNTGKWRYGVSLPARRHRRHIQLENKRLLIDNFEETNSKEEKCEYTLETANALIRI